MTPEALWADYCSATGVTGPLPSVEAFGDTDAMKDELLALVLDGTKQASCSLARDFLPDDMPSEGDHWIIKDSKGSARAIVRTRRVTHLPVREVTAEMAYIEGEGDRSLTYWKEGHDAFFTRQGQREGFIYSDEMTCVFEEFDCVWRA